MSERIQPHAQRMALSWDEWQGSLPEPKRVALQQHLANVPDPETEKRKMTAIQWVAEREKMPVGTVARNFEQAKAGFAAKYGWGDVAKDDSAFYGRVVSEAAMDRDEKTILQGFDEKDYPNTPTEEIQKSREESLLERAYWSAAEEDYFDAPGETAKSKADMVGDFQKWQEARRGKPGYKVGRDDQYFRMFEAQYRQGEADKAAAVGAIKEIAGDMAIVSVTSDSRERLNGILDKVERLTPRQRSLAFKYLSTYSSEAEKTTPPTGAGDALSRAIRNIGSSLDRSARRDVFERLQFEEGDLVPSGEVAASIDEMAKRGSKPPRGADVFGGEGLSTLTKEQADAYNAEVERRMARLDLERQVIDAAQGIVNPVAKDSIAKMAGYTALESLPTMSLMASPVGWAAAYDNYRNNAYEDMVAEGMKRKDADTLAPFIGAAQAGLDRLQLGFLKKAPGVEKFIGKWTQNAAVRAGVRFTATTTAETATELTQDVLVEAMAKDVYSYLTDNIPGTDWSQVGEDLQKAAPETLVSMMLLSSLGAGHAHLGDVKGADTLVRSPEALRLLGFNEEQIGNVVYASNGKAGQLFLEEFAKRSPVLPGDSAASSPSEAAAFAQEQMKAGATLPVLPTTPEAPEPVEEESDPFNIFAAIQDEPLTASSTPSDFRTENETANADAGVTRMFRDESGGWHLELESPKPGATRIIDAGNVETALQIRDELAKKNLTESITELEEESTKAAEQIVNESEAYDKDAAREAQGLETAPLSVTTNSSQTGSSSVVQQNESAAPREESGADTGGLAEPVPTGAPQTDLPKGSSKTENVNSGLPLLSAEPDERREDPPHGISISNANVAMQRETRDLGPRMKPLASAWGPLWNQVLGKVAEDETYGQRLAQDLLVNPRPITDFEQAALTHELARRDVAYKEQKKRVEAAKTPTLKEAEMRTLKDMRDRDQEIFELTEGLGTVTARSLAARKIHIDDRFSLMRMLSEEQFTANGGEKVSDARKDAVEKEFNAIQAAREKLSVTEEEALNAKVAELLDQHFGALADARTEAAAAKAKGKPPRQWLKEKAEAAVKRNAERSARLGAGQQLFSLAMWADTAWIVANDIANGVTKLADIAKRLKDMFGESVEPHIKALAEAGKEIFDAAMEADKEPKTVVTKRKKEAAEDMGAALARAELDAAEGNPLPDKRTVYELARAHVISGKHGVDQVMGAVFKDLTPHFPAITEREVREIFTDYGKAIFPSQEAVKKELRELRTLTRLQITLDRLHEKLPILKTGLQRDKATAEVRKLTKEINDLKRKLGIAKSSPAQLAGILDAVKTRLLNEIEDIEGKISRGGTSKEEAAPRPGLAYDAEAAALLKKRNELKEILAKLDGPKEITEERRIELTLAALERAEELLTRQLESGANKKLKKDSVTNEEIELRRSYLATMRRELKARHDSSAEGIAAKVSREEEAARKSYERAELEYRRRVRENDISGPDKRLDQPESPEVASARQKRDEAKEEYENLRAGRQDEIDLARDKKAVESRIRKLEEALKKPFAPKTKRERAMDAELMRLRYEEAQLKEAHVRRQFEAGLALRTLPRKITDGIGEFLHLVRTVITSLDVSAVLRQGGFIAVGHPIMASKLIKGMFKAAWSESHNMSLQHSLKQRDNAKLGLYKAAGLDILDSESMTLAKMEEAYMGRWIQKIPRLAGGGLIRGSARAYTSFLNQLRADAFDTLAATLTNTGKPTLEEAKAIANYVNVATGRGKFTPKLNLAAVPLNTVFFAPKYVTSRWQLLAWQPIWRGTARTRKLVALEYGRYLLGMATVYALYALFHAGDDDDKVERNWRSAAFGKLKFGNTYLDPLSGLAQNTVLFGRLVTNETKTADGLTKSLEPGNMTGQRNRGDVLGYYLRSKLSPFFGATWSGLVHEDMRGDTTGFAREYGRMLIPLMARDVAETMQEQGVPRGTAIVLAAAFGWGVQNYDDEVREPISDKDANWLYKEEIVIPRLSKEATEGSILGLNKKVAVAAEMDAVLTDEQRTALLKKTAPAVEVAIKDAREALKDAPTDEAELEALKTGVQRTLDAQVNAARRAAVGEVVR